MQTDNDILPCPYCGVVEKDDLIIETWAVDGRTSCIFFAIRLV